MNKTMGHAARNDHPGLTAPILITALVAAIAIGRTESVLAQNNLPIPNPQSADPRPPISQDRMEAPIGHRQPRPQDLPPAVRREEGQRTPAERELDEKLQICRGC